MAGDLKAILRIARAATAAGAGLLSLLSVSAVQAQSIMRTPNLNIGSRVPTLAPSTVPRINPNLGISRTITGMRSINTNAGRVVGTAVRDGVTTRVVSTGNRTGRKSAGATGSAIAVVPTIAYLRYAPNSYPICSSADRDGSGECKDPPLLGLKGNGSFNGPPPRNQNGGAGRGSLRGAVGPRYVANEIVAELDGTLSDAQAAELARRHRLIRVGSENFPLIGSSIGLFRIADGRSVETVRRELSADAGFRSVQPNFRYLLQDQKSTPVSVEGDPAQYAVAKLRLPQAHVLAHGTGVVVAVIDSAIDATHPELISAISGSFDALGSPEGPHVHGTGIAGAIVSHGRLIGSAPSARILAIRAFAMAKSGAESTSFVILKSLDYAVSHDARIVNMSFAGPRDSLVERAVAGAAGKGIVLVAASGNAGPKSPPLYPAANPGVIAVSATDAADRLFPASNRGSHIALAAPGVDIFLPAPDGKYQMTSGTSFSAAYVSGLAALMLERNPELKSDDLRAILSRTARDLGAPGRDDMFGAGEADAFGAVSAVTASATPTAAENVPAPEATQAEAKSAAPQ